jgi:hypothetical protein
MTPILIALIFILCGVAAIRHRPVVRCIERVKARAVPPEPRQLQGLAEAFQASRDPAVLVAMGDAYRSGAFPRFAPDPEAAGILYRAAGVPERPVEVPAEDRGPPDAPTLPRIGILEVLRNEDPPTPPTVPDEAPRSDAQNVHDHAVVRSIAGTLDGLTFDQDVDAARESMTATVLDAEDLSAAEKSDAIMALDSLSPEPHSVLGRSEQEVLAAVLARIPEASRGVLGKQLASAVEHGHVVCSTGKIARIAGALDGLDLEGHRDVAPTWAVREELAGLAVRMRDQGRSAQDFVQAAEKTYLDDLGLSRDVVGPHIDAMVHGFA